VATTAVAGRLALGIETERLRRRNWIVLVVVVVVEILLGGGTDARTVSVVFVAMVHVVMAGVTSGFVVVSSGGTASQRVRVIVRLALLGMVRFRRGMVSIGR
jgi:hypothetical protein